MSGDGELVRRSPRARRAASAAATGTDQAPRGSPPSRPRANPLYRRSTVGCACCRLDRRRGPSRPRLPAFHVGFGSGPRPLASLGKIDGLARSRPDRKGCTAPIMRMCPRQWMERVPFTVPGKRSRRPGRSSAREARELLRWSRAHRRNRRWRRTCSFVVAEPLARAIGTVLFTIFRRPAADQLLVLHQRDVGLHPGGVAIHHECDRPGGCENGDLTVLETLTPFRGSRASAQETSRRPPSRSSSRRPLADTDVRGVLDASRSLRGRACDWPWNASEGAHGSLRSRRSSDRPHRTSAR